MKKLRDLNFKQFEPKQQTNSSCAISMEEFLSSKEPGRGSGRQFIDLSGHQILVALGNLIPTFNPKESLVHVYRDHFSHPGYVLKQSQYDNKSQLITPELELSELCFERAIARIDTGFSDADHKQQLAVKYTSDGTVEVVMGTVVRVCDNWNIMSYGEESLRLSTSKRAGIDFEALAFKVQKWMEKAQEYFQMDLAIIKWLRSIQIAPSETYELMGMLMDRYYGDPVLQITEISKMAQSIHSDFPTDLWAFTNHGTAQVRFDAGDQEFDRIQAFNSFVIGFTDIMANRAGAFTHAEIVEVVDTPVRQLAVSNGENGSSVLSL